MPRLAGLLFAVVVAAMLIVATTAKSAYDKECDKMIKAAKAAAAKFNKGDKQGAEAQIARVRASFSKAKKMDPNHPQAYLNFAIFASNTHKYQESLEAFETAQKLLGDTNPQATQQIQQSMAKAKYEMYSMHRDQTYMGGNGNLFEAHEWGEKQLSVTREPHRIKHDLATMEIMMCDANVSYCDSARKNFQGASVSSFQKHVYMSVSQITDPDLRNECMHSKLHVGSWQHHSAVTAKEVETGLFFNTIDTVVHLQGRDGIMTIADLPGDCSVLSPASDFYPNLADNIDPKRPFEEGYMPQKVLSLIKFSGAAFYHWLCEIVPALVIAKQQMSAAEFSQYILLVPSIKEELPSFINQTLFDLFKGWEGLSEERVIPYTPNAKLPTGSVAVTWNEQRCPGAPDEEVPSSYGCAALTHPAALRAARKEIQAALGPLVVPFPNKGTENPQDPGDAYILFAMRGAGVTMRNLNELSLYNKLANLVASVSLTKTFTIRTFESANYNFTESLQLFRGASIVVGAHGGALSNIIACNENAHLVEIGFRTKAAMHYRHMAESLGMKYDNINVAPDEEYGRGLGATNIDVEEQDVLTAVFNAMKAIDSGDEGKRNEEL